MVATAVRPLTDIRALRRITRVITADCVYDPAALWGSVDFNPR